MILQLQDAKAVENLLGYQYRQVTSRRQQNGAPTQEGRRA
jgi:hypothetical protein